MSENKKIATALKALTALSAEEKAELIESLNAAKEENPVVTGDANAEGKGADVALDPAKVSEETKDKPIVMEDVKVKAREVMATIALNKKTGDISPIKVGATLLGIGAVAAGAWYFFGKKKDETFNQM